ncbi:MAG: Uncharacterised protein [Cellulomonadaceae bacterium TMED98]|nr:MAG: Uncharacterised protein [Cellulomonadaceae bacterium TMED98]
MTVGIDSCVDTVMTKNSADSVHRYSTIQKPCGHYVSKGVHSYLLFGMRGIDHSSNTCSLDRPEDIPPNHWVPELACED